MTVELPPTIGRYEVVELAGKGATGVVFKARDPVIGRTLAIKMIASLAALPHQARMEFRERFVREAQFAGNLHHQNIATLYDIGEGYFLSQREYGPFQLGLQTRSDQTQQALDIANKTLGDYVQQGPSEKELTAAISNITGGFALRIDSNAKLTEYLGMISFYNLPLDYLDNFVGTHSCRGCTGYS